MNSPIFALFNRALRLESRSFLAYVVRIFVLLPILLFLYVMKNSYIDATGLHLFAVVSWVDFMIISIVGVGYFPLVIQEKKEEKILPLMSLTGLNSFTVLFGKFISRLLFVSQLLLLQLPFVMLLITFGGVSKEMIFLLFFALLAYTVFINGLALFCSVFFDNNKHAVIATIVLLICFTMLLLFITIFVSRVTLFCISFDHVLFAMLNSLKFFVCIIIVALFYFAIVKKIKRIASE